MHTWMGYIIIYQSQQGPAGILYLYVNVKKNIKIQIIIYQPIILMPPQTTTVSFSREAATFFHRIAGRDGTAFRQFPPETFYRGGSYKT